MWPLIWGAVALVLLAEIYVTGLIGARIGVWDTLALFALKGVFGMRLLLRESFHAFHEVSGSLRARRVPRVPVVETFLILLAGILFVFPGFVTGAMGAVLLVPRARRRVARWLSDFVLARLTGRLLR